MSGRVAYAVTHDDPPQVFLAEDEIVLSRVLAVQLVAATPPSSLPAGSVESIREALLEERWADARRSRGWSARDSLSTSTRRVRPSGRTNSSTRSTRRSSCASLGSSSTATMTMPDDRTTVTELATALGLMGHATVADAIARDLWSLRVPLEAWLRLADLEESGRFSEDFDRAFENGRAFLAASDGLRGVDRLLSSGQEDGGLPVTRSPLSICRSITST